MSRKLLNQMFELAMREDFSTEDRDYRGCSPTEVMLFGEMVVAMAKVGALNDHPSPEQWRAVEVVGGLHNVPADKCGRFFRRMRDIAVRRKLNVDSFGRFWNGMRDGR